MNRTGFRLLLTVLLMAFCGYAGAQAYNNEWIDFSKTYYKFKVGSDGVYRISQSVLTAAGLGTADASTFQLWRNGVQVPIYTTSPSGILPANGYIEFYGRINDGKPDNPLYLQPTFQTCDHWSLETDTAVYFLTVNPGGGNLRVSDVPNTVATNHLAPEPYYMCRTGNYFKAWDNGVYLTVDGSYIISSSYDAGEGYIDGNGYFVGSPFSNTFSGLNVYAAGPPSTVRIGLANLSFENRTMELAYNTGGASHVLKDTAISQTQGFKISGTVPTSQLAAGTVGVTMTDVNGDGNDEFTVGFTEVTYPSPFSFGGGNHAFFTFPASDTGNYLQVTSFTYGAVAPVLLDLTNGLRITGDLTVPGMVQFVLPASMTNRELALISEDPGTIQQVTSLQTKQFTNFALAANQGDFLVISNPLLYNDGSGNNNVEAYRSYRASAAGGGYNAKTIDIGELVDQFAFGIKMHPLSIKNFLRYARNVFTAKPKFAFLIGKAVAYPYVKSWENIPTIYKLALLPTFGNPPSDMLLANDGNQFGGNATPLGRLSVVNGAEIAPYLQKVKEYELLQNNYTGTIAGEAWKKNVIHVVGADALAGDIIQLDLQKYQGIISDTAYGGLVYTFRKTSTTNVQDLSNQQITDLFSSGVGLVNYFGHSSSNILGYNLGDPTQFNMKGKYPFFLANGCDAGDMYEPDSARLTSNGLTVTEKFVLASENGAIGYMGSSSIGIVSYLDVYNTQLYNDLSILYYGAPSGIQMMHTTQTLGNTPSFASDFYGRCCMEQLSLNGDPAITFYHNPKPDYAIEAPEVVINPSIISVADNQFTAQIYYYNLGMATSDSILVTVKWQLPDGTVTTLYSQKRLAPPLEDSIALTIPINPTKDKGNNSLTVDLNADGKVSELSMANNVVTKSFFIYDQDVTPVYPAAYSIVGKSPIVFYASSADPLDSVRNYIYEIDTTALFNSPGMVKLQAASKGGVLSFTPSLSYKDSTVYYWRVAILPANGAQANWSLSSFMYVNGSTPGWNQSHYYQWQNDTYNLEGLDSDRVFSFPQTPHTLQVMTQIYPYGGDQADAALLDGYDVSSSGCGGTLGSLSFLLINQSHNLVLYDTINPTTGVAKYGSSPNCSALPYGFSFPVLTTANRKAAMSFFDSIPGGTIFAMWAWMWSTDTTQFIGAWKSDTSVFGSGVSLYNTFKNMGFNTIDSFNRLVPILYIARKEMNGTYTIFYQKVGTNVGDQLTGSMNFNSTLQQGSITSTVVGPAKTWQEIQWNGSWDNPADSLQVQVYGIKKDSTQTLLYTSNSLLKDTSLSFISAATYPELQIKMTSKDSVLQTPYQLKRLMIHYQDAPEGAIAPNHYFTCPDTLQDGQPLDFGVAFQNISDAAFDSIQVQLTITDNQNITHTIPLSKTKPLAVGDSVHLLDTIASQNYIGKNTLYVNFNPNYAQPEQYLTNNFLYKTFYVKPNNYMPTMDVTFDGVHILNQDIVSARPQITVKLQDNSKYLALSDSTDITVSVLFPDGTTHLYKTGTDSAQFIPANLSTGKNIAMVILHPSFIEDGSYTLTVSGQDQSGNTAGRLSYSVNFRVINTPMISNVFNYPNPFTTSTAFVFTITGSEVPQELRIEILSITGKIVREITEAELGPLHIGRNITQFKWNGTDQYGNKVGNGVYLYRVITNLNGKKLGKFTDQGDNTNQYFKSGYGKMYLMR
ncbi:putative type IX secretion system sortase PorU2 [Dinghuibacter silviterrae]|uniref:Peptidase C25-like protein n=1 Tax=Dinghuibacter silviterrae TaxID=1539049 RepID=A0A4R8DEZ1_9BACT|nr:C25 family cysteine peptidase [Dinghuibacter silviterrae]TDW95848.1 peptidase C25-like protein [Dinghuibacter silviterrae]